MIMNKRTVSARNHIFLKIVWKKLNVLSFDFLRLQLYLGGGRLLEGVFIREGRLLQVSMSWGGVYWRETFIR